MSRNYCENTRVQVPAALHLCKLGYTYLDEKGLGTYDPRTNILTDVLLRSIRRINPNMGDGAVEQFYNNALSKLESPDLGREFYNMLTAAGSQRLIDYEHPENNEWHVTTEFTCRNDESGDEFRPDITCFVNGMPLAFIEVKIPNNKEGIKAESQRIDRRMQNKQFKRFINITQLMIFSNNQEYDKENRVPVQGVFYCCSARKNAFLNVFREEDKSWVSQYPYKEVDDEVKRKILKHRNCVVIENTKEYNTNCKVATPTNRVLTSMLSRERFLFLLRYGFAYLDSPKESSNSKQTTELQKHVMRYQQMFATMAIHRALEKGIKGGIIWHTQGSGKTALAYYNVKFLTDYYAKKETIAKFYFIVDRIDLMQQASDEFTSRGLTVHNVDSRDALMKDMASTDISKNNEGKLEITVVNIQKFKEDHQKITLKNTYSTHLQRVFFIDEAHRGYAPDGCFLANLLEADRNSVKIALTGTPLLKNERESWRIFGDYIHTYYYDKSIEDGYTLKLMREPIETKYKEKIEKVIEGIAGAKVVKKKDIETERIYEHHSYLNALLDYITEDFQKFRKEQNDDKVGAMIVCRTNQQAREMYRLWQERNEESECSLQADMNELQMAAEPLSLSYYNPKGKQLTACLILHDEGDKAERKENVKEFKKDMTIDILIVNKMLLTGFDAPRLKKLYLGRLLDGHDLLQALTRVNRPFQKFMYGYVVDFVNIKDNFEETNNRYLRELGRVTTDDTTGDGNVAETLQVSTEEVTKTVEEVSQVIEKYTVDNLEEFRLEVDQIEYEEIDTLYELRKTLEKAKATINLVRAFGDEKTRGLIEKLPIDSFPTLVAEVSRKIDRLNMLNNDNSDERQNIQGLINLIMCDLEFEFTKQTSEELRIAFTNIMDRFRNLQNEFASNFDQKDEKFVNLAEELRTYLSEHDLTPKTTEDSTAHIAFFEQMMAQIRKINSENRTIKNKYNGDERFARIHKRIREQKEKNPDKPLISDKESEVRENLVKMKEMIDNLILDNINIIENDEYFRIETLSIVSRELVANNIKASIADRKDINNLIVTEYLTQYNNL